MPQEPPRFSIILPAYNEALYLEQMLRSAFDQDFHDLEIVLVNDGSTDDTPEIAERLASNDPRLRIISQPNAGCASASNTAWAAARGTFGAIIGADDVYLPEYFSTQARFIDEHPGYDFYTCNGLNLYPDGSTAQYVSHPRQHELTSYVLADWFRGMPVLGIALIRRDVWRRVGGYRVQLRNAEDYDFWLRAMASGATHIHNPATLAMYRRHPQSKSANRVKAAKAVLRILVDLEATANLTAEEREQLVRETSRRRAAVGRREMEQRFIDGDYTHGRRDFLRFRTGYADTRKYWVAAAIALVSPRSYTRLVLRGKRIR